MLGIIISANHEWRTVKSILNPKNIEQTPYGESFATAHGVFMQGGWGKVDAAASCQYLISNWKPTAVINFGTCGGIGGQIDKGAILLAEETIIYDIYEKMYDADQAIDAYRTKIDLTWLPAELPMKNLARGILLSADRDLDPSDIPLLIEKYRAIAVDWESGSIARVCKKNQIPVLILRGISDLVFPNQNHVYEINKDDFEENTFGIMNSLLQSLEHWCRILL